MSKFISAVAWIPRGKAAQHPEKYNLDEAELARIQDIAKIEIQDAQRELELAQELEAAGDGPADDDGWEDESTSDKDEEGDVEMETGDTDDMAKYNLDNYDNERSTGAAMGAFSNIKGLQFYRDQGDDPYVTLDNPNEDEDQEREDLEILPSDNLLIVAKTAEDLSILEAYVYDDPQDNLYAHHDLLLPAMPLCLEWMDYKPHSNSAESANYIAVGTMDPQIEIWNMDVVEGLFPDAILGAPKDTAENGIPQPVQTTVKKKKKKKDATNKIDPAHFHTDSVLGLSWNRTHRSLLASASADQTVKLWDLSLPANSPALRSYSSLHSDKVQAVQWNPTDPTVLLSGGWDGCVRAFDSRAAESGVGARVSAKGDDVECIRWDPWTSYNFMASTSSGLVLAFDSRTLSSSPSATKASQPLWTLSAHEGGVSALDANPHVKGCVVTGGVDKKVKIWNIDESGPSRSINLVVGRDVGVGKVFATSFSPDDTAVLACAGSSATLQLWDLTTNAGFRKSFEKQLKAAGVSIKERGRERLIGVNGGDVDSDEEDDD